MNVLLVDDTGYIRIILKHVLNSIGHMVTGEASDGQEAIRLYRQLQPDLVIMDITMPNMNGIDAVKSIINLNPHARIIMCSASAHRNLIIDCIRAGAVDFVAKPFDMNKLTESIRKISNIPANSTT